jgi:hypothetical protein
MTSPVSVRLSMPPARKVRLIEAPTPYISRSLAWKSPRESSD